MPTRDSIAKTELLSRKNRKEMAVAEAQTNASRYGTYATWALVGVTVLLVLLSVANIM